MSRNRDPLGYYAALGVDSSASIERIKKAFKAKAQEVHPDKNRSADATQQFQFLNEAYQVLGDPQSRSEYDATAYTFVEHTEIEKHGEIPIQPIVCCVCGKISVQPRYAIYRHVVSFLVVTHRGGHQGVFCANCGAKRAYRNSLITWALGWWGFPWGPIYSIQAIVRNMIGGEQPPLSNFRVLAMQAAHFGSSGRMDLARVLADQALEFAGKVPAFQRNQDSPADRDLKGLLMAIRTATPPPTRTLKPSWGTGSLPFKIQAFASSLVTIALLALVISASSVGRTAYRHAAPSDLFDQVASKGGESTVSKVSSVDQFMSRKPAAPEVLATQPAAASIGQQNIAFNEPIRTLPRTGRMHIMRKRADNTLAPLKIVSFSGSPDYYVKLVDWTTHVPIIFFFIRSGEALSADVPLGEYELRYAAGSTWYGEEYLFGPDTSYSKADAQLIFEREGNKVSGYTLRLAKQVLGNLREISISPSEF